MDDNKPLPTTLSIIHAWLVLTYDDDIDTCTAQALWPRRTSAVEIASRDATDEDETDEHQT